MTNKSTTFKRVALAVVAALGFGVLSSGSSSALLNGASDAPALALSATSATAAPGETVSVTVTVNFTSTAKYESVNVVTNDLGSTNITERFKGLTTDSANVWTPAATAWQGGDRAGMNTYSQLETKSTFSVFASTRPDSVVTATGTGVYVNSGATDGTPTPVQAKLTLEFIVGTGASPAVYTYAVTLRDDVDGNGTYTNYVSKNFSLTVTALDTAATAAKSKLYVNQALCTLDLCTGTRSGGDAYGIEADSTLVVSAGTVAGGTAQSFTAVGYMFGIFNNAADTKTVISGSAVSGSMVVTISGQGWLSTRTGGSSTKAKSVTITASNDTITIWSDGTPGTGTITGYFGTTALTQAAKTVTFYGKATTITATETTVALNNGGTALSSTPADSITIGTKLVTFTAKDAAGNAVTDLTMNSNGTLYCVSSDTSVIGTGTGSSATAAHKAATAISSGVWGCDMVIRSAGTASVTIADESVVANSAYTSTAKSFTFAKTVTGASAYKGIGTITFDKSSYNVGDKAVITVTVKNAASAVPGMVKVAGDAMTTASVFPTLNQNRAFSGYFTENSINYGFGDGTGLTFSLTSSTFVKGVETYVVFMPNTAGKITLTGYTTDGTYDTATAVSVSVDVVDPLEAVINAQVAAAQAAAVAASNAAKAEATAAIAAADAATDAALQAIDAANAATDAANLAAEAADAATVAAEEAKDAADAATAAVEGLATQVATLMAALQAQVRSLANTVAKIAKKVKA